MLFMAILLYYWLDSGEDLNDCYMTHSISNDLDLLEEEINWIEFKHKTATELLCSPYCGPQNEFSHLVLVFFTRNYKIQISHLPVTFCTQNMQFFTNHKWTDINLIVHAIIIQ
jgi:hypothetical protein